MANDFGHQSASHAQRCSRLASTQAKSPSPERRPYRGREGPEEGPKTSQAKSRRPEHVCGLCCGGCW